MSKLLKLKAGLNSAEAADLLGSLISEKITTKNIDYLYESGWLTAFYFSDATLLCLHPINLAERQFRVDGDKGAGHISKVYLPCETVNILGNIEAYTVVDRAGNYYAIRDNEGIEIHGMYSMYNDFTELYFEPREIYRIAEVCNSSGMPGDSDKITPTLNTCAEFPGAQDFYNFRSSDTSISSPKKAALPEEAPRASQLLAIASILDIAIEKTDKKFNQNTLIDEVLSRSGGKRGLSQSGLTKLFAAAKKAAEDWKE